MPLKHWPFISSCGLWEHGIWQDRAGPWARILPVLYCCRLALPGNGQDWGLGDAVIGSYEGFPVKNCLLAPLVLGP